jgi:hypothetical protein
VILGHGRYVQFEKKFFDASKWLDFGRFLLVWLEMREKHGAIQVLTWMTLENVLFLVFARQMIFCSFRTQGTKPRLHPSSENLTHVTLMHQVLLYALERDG